MKKGLACCIVFGLLIVVSNLAYAETVKIGYFDARQVLIKSRRGDVWEKTVQKRQDELNKVIQKKEQELDALRESLEKKATMLSEDVKKEKERDYQQKLKELERFKKDSRDELKQMDMELYTTLMKSLAKVVAKLGKEEKYTVILEKSLIAYAADELDMTDKVIKAFDASKE